MENLQIINNERLSHGYTTNNIKTYKKHCNKMRKTHKNDPKLSLLYRLESNISKYKMLKSKAFLYKNRKLLKTNESLGDFIQIYSKYTECLIKSSKNCSEIDEIIQLRNQLADYYAFLEDVYEMADNRHDFDQYKVKYMWNDIIILFETEKILESFKDGTFCLNNYRFNTQLSRKILSLEKAKKNLFAFLKSNCDVFESFKLANVFFGAICDLERFLDDNYVESAFIKELKDSCEKVLSFLNKIAEYSNGIFHSDIDSFTVPKHFEEVSAEIEKLKKEKKIDNKKLRSILLDIVEKGLEIDAKPRKMPLLPVFYDLANDYIDYSSVDNSAAGVMQNFQFFGKK